MKLIQSCSPQILRSSDPHLFLFLSCVFGAPAEPAAVRVCGWARHPPAWLGCLFRAAFIPSTGHTAHAGHGVAAYVTRGSFFSVAGLFMGAAELRWTGPWFRRGFQPALDVSSCLLHQQVNIPTANPAAPSNQDKSVTAQPRRSNLQINQLPNMSSFIYSFNEFTYPNTNI